VSNISTSKWQEESEGENATNNKSAPILS
jgi:hypothetical protein